MKYKHDGKPGGVTMTWLPRLYNAKIAYSSNLKISNEITFSCPKQAFALWVMTTLIHKTWVTL